jgi:hypothetical protein
MNRVFADSFYFFALLNPKDIAHREHRLDVVSRERDEARRNAEERALARSFER